MSGEKEFVRVKWGVRVKWVRLIRGNFALVEWGFAGKYESIRLIWDFELSGVYCMYQCVHIHNVFINIRNAMCIILSLSLSK